MEKKPNRPGMAPDMKGRIDRILEIVKEPESGRSVSDLNLVSRVTYSEKESKLLVVTDIGTPRSTCAVCGVVTEHIRQSIMRDLLEAFTQEFPDLSVEVV